MAVPATEKGPGPAAQGQPVLSLRGVNKSFGAVHVLHGVDLDCYAGQVTALVGDNGAGKSTLIKGVAGIHPFDDGDMLWEGEKVHVTGPRQANALGIEIVYQDLALCDNLDVVHNMFLGRELKSDIRLKETAMEKRAGETLRSLSVRTLRSLRQQVSSLSGGQRQTVAIARRCCGTQARDPRRADRGARRGADRAGAQPGAAARRQRAGRDPDHAQHERRLPGRRQHRVPVPRPAGGAGLRQGRHARLRWSS
jgi:ABC-type lipoprotein export system ATPase subunit